MAALLVGGAHGAAQAREVNLDWVGHIEPLIGRITLAW